MTHKSDYDRGGGVYIAAREELIKFNGHKKEFHKGKSVKSGIKNKLVIGILPITFAAIILSVLLIRSTVINIIALNNDWKAWTISGSVISVLILIVVFLLIFGITVICLFFKSLIKLIDELKSNLADREKFTSLGQLAGGISHNLRSPLMAVSGAVEALKELISEYERSIGDSCVTEEDHHDIAKEMLTWVEKIKPQCSYMSDIISAVKGQAGRNGTSCGVSFTLEELLKRIDILMGHELKTFRCKIQKDIRIDLSTGINGEISSLIQVLNNLIVNAIHSYEGKEGIIYFSIMESGNNVEFIISDKGKGIEKEIQAKLFKEMITTKGTCGSGLGLYMSYSTIKEYFGGDITFESYEGSGTAVHIIIPFAVSHNDKGSWLK